MFFLIAFFVAKGKSVYKNGPKRQRIPIKERQHYAELILGGADYSTINLMYKQKDKKRMDLSRRTYFYGKDDATKILAKDTSSGKYNLSEGKRSTQLKKFGEEVRRK